MNLFEIALLGVALAMDACAVSMTNGMLDPKLKPAKALTIGVFFGFFQFFMPLIGFFITGLVANTFFATFEKISSWISFILLGFLGGKMLWEFFRTQTERKNTCCDLPPQQTGEAASLSYGKLVLQAIATSIDALAVGVTLQMATLTGDGLALGVWGATLVIGGITFLLSVGAVYLGKAVGDKLADKAGLFGGLVLLAIGIKILLEGLL